MSWLKTLLRKAVSFGSGPSLPPEVTAIFDKLGAYLENERAQNERLPGPLRKLVETGLSCDQLPSGTGRFGRDITNSVPVNGRLGELIYLSNLLHHSGQRLLFHRLGSIDGIDAYEIATLDGCAWEILYFDFYHPRKSKQAPARFIIAPRRPTLFYGTNDFVEHFPKNINVAVAKAFERTTGVSMCAPELRIAVESTQFIPPPDHVARVRAVLNMLSGKTISQTLKNVAPSMDFTTVSLSEGQEQFVQGIERLSEVEASEAYALLVSIVHQMQRHKKGLGNPLALDAIEVFCASFANYVNHLDQLSADDLSNDYEILRCTSVKAEEQGLRRGAEACMVIILGEMIRREGAIKGEQDMSGYQRAVRMLNRLEQANTKSTNSNST